MATALSASAIVCHVYYENFLLQSFALTCIKIWCQKVETWSSFLHNFLVNVSCSSVIVT